MKLEFTPYPRPEEEGPHSDRAAAREAAPSRSGKRSDPRCRIEAKAFVAIPGLTSRAYEVGEISRGGMFLGFREAHSTLLLAANVRTAHWTKIPPNVPPNGVVQRLRTLIEEDAPAP